jgi:hypothetical protein
MLLRDAKFTHDYFLKRRDLARTFVEVAQDTAKTEIMNKLYNDLRTSQ